MPTVSKGSGFNSYAATAREMLGEERWANVVTQVSAATRELLGKPPMAMAWIPDAHWNELTHVLSRTEFKDAPEQFAELGRRQMHRDLSTLYKVLMHLVSPETVVKKAATLYSTYTRNGHMSAETLAPHHLEVTVADVEDSLPQVWFFHIGSIKGTLECAGAKNVQVRVKAGGGGANFCTYDVTFD